METLTLGDQISQARQKTMLNFLELQTDNPTIDYTGLQTIGPGLGLREFRLLLNEYVGAADLVVSPGPKFENGHMLWEVKKMLNDYFGTAEPVDAYGPNELSNSTFNTSNDWVYDPAEWKISQSALICNGVQSAPTEAIGVAGKIVSGETYRITMNVSVINAGAVTAYVGDTDPGGTLSITEPGLHSFEAVAGDSIAQVVVVGDATFQGAIDWIVVQLKL